MAVLFKEDMNYGIEFAICQQSIFYFMEKYLKLSLHDAQCDILVDMINMKDGDNFDITACRRFGSSTILSVAALWLAMFHPGTKIALCNEQYNISRENKSIVYKLHETFEKQLPEEIQRTQQSVATIRFSSIERLIFDNGSEINFVYNASNGLRGKSIDYYLLDNCSIDETYLLLHSKKVLKISS